MKKIFIVVLIFITLLLISAPVSLAETNPLDWNFFILYNSPAWVWGQNGAILSPTSEIGADGIYFSGNILNTGNYYNEPAGFCANSLMISSGDLEVGLSKKYLLLNWQRLDIDFTILHFRYQPIVSKTFNVAVGYISVEMSPFPLVGVFSDKYFSNIFAVAGYKLGRLTLNAGAEFAFMGKEQKRVCYFINGKVPNLFLGLTLVGEFIAIDPNQDDKGGIYNIALASNNRHLNYGIGALGLSGGDPQLTLFGSFKY